MLPPLQNNVPLSRLSTFGIGGPAAYYAEAKTIKEMQALLCYAKEHSLPFFVLGKGSNSLFDDKGFNGLVIANKIAFMECKDNTVFVGAGYSFSLLGTQLAKMGLSGLEFASGIPATVGGAIYMNAGANGQQTAHALKEVTFVHSDTKIQTFTKEELFFSYRTSSFQSMKGAIVSATFTLEKQDSARNRQLEIIAYRKKTQPYNDLSCGCIFRNPPGDSAGALIERCGLIGHSYGGASVSPVHANFIVNKGFATAADVLALAQHIKTEVNTRTGIELEMEVRFVPFIS